MHVETLYSYARFEALKADWDALYDKDPDAQFFLSWLWLSRIFQQHPDEWCVRPRREAPRTQPPQPGHGREPVLVGLHGPALRPGV